MYAIVFEETLSGIPDVYLNLRFNDWVQSADCLSPSRCFSSIFFTFTYLLYLMSFWQEEIRPLDPAREREKTLIGVISRTAVTAGSYQLAPRARAQFPLSSIFSIETFSLNFSFKLTTHFFYPEPNYTYINCTSVTICYYWSFDFFRLSRVKKFCIHLYKHSTYVDLGSWMH